jgi:hypothetical protein
VGIGTCVEFSGKIHNNSSTFLKKNPRINLISLLTEFFKRVVMLQNYIAWKLTSNITIHKIPRRRQTIKLKKKSREINISEKKGS